MAYSAIISDDSDGTEGDHCGIRFSRPSCSLGIPDFSVSVLAVESVVPDQFPGNAVVGRVETKTKTHMIAVIRHQSHPMKQAPQFARSDVGYTNRLVWPQAPPGTPDGQSLPSPDQRAFPSTRPVPSDPIWLRRASFPDSPPPQSLLRPGLPPRCRLDCAGRANRSVTGQAVRELTQPKATMSHSAAASSVR